MGKLERKEEKKKKNILGVSHFWFVVGNEGEFILFFFFSSFFQTAVLWFGWNYLGKREEKKKSER